MFYEMEQICQIIKFILYSCNDSYNSLLISLKIIYILYLYYLYYYVFILYYYIYITFILYIYIYIYIYTYIQYAKENWGKRK